MVVAGRVRVRTRYIITSGTVVDAGTRGNLKYITYSFNLI